MSGLNHYKYIDALRGFAFLGVLTIHASKEVPDLPFSTIPVMGEYGVQLFFLLSAVTLLRSVALRTSKENSPLRNFFLRRFFRIAPLFWTGLVFYSLLDGSGPRYAAPDGLGLWQYLSTVLFLHGWAPTTINSIVPGGWSIAVEMTFYLCLPFLARWITTARQACVLALSWTAATVALNWMLTPFLLRMTPPEAQHCVPHFLFFWFPFQLPVFLLGFAVYYWLHDPAVTTFLAKPRRPAFLLIAALAGFAVLTRLTSAPLVPAHILAAGVAILVILALAARPYAAVVNPLTCSLGTISFSCYITHFTAVRVAAHYLPSEHFASLPLRFALVSRFAAIWLGGLLLTIPAAVLTYAAIEKPGMKLGSRLIRALEARRGAAQPQIAGA